MTPMFFGSMLACLALVTGHPVIAVLIFFVGALANE